MKKVGLGIFSILVILLIPETGFFSSYSEMSESIMVKSTMDSETIMLETADVVPIDGVMLNFKVYLPSTEENKKKSMLFTTKSLSGSSITVSAADSIERSQEVLISGLNPITLGVNVKIEDLSDWRVMIPFYKRVKINKEYTVWGSAEIESNSPLFKHSFSGTISINGSFLLTGAISTEKAEKLIRDRIIEICKEESRERLKEIGYIKTQVALSPDADIAGNLMHLMDRNHLILQGS